MCKLAIAIKDKNPENNTLCEKALRAQFDDMRREPHGAGCLVVTHDGRVGIHRSYADYDSVFLYALKYLPEAKLIALHTRTSTSGTTDEQNVHFFGVGDWVIAHNGFVGAYHSYKYQGWNNDNGSIPSFEYDEEALDTIEKCNACTISQGAQSGLCSAHKHLKKQYKRAKKAGFQTPLTGTKLCRFGKCTDWAKDGSKHCEKHISVDKAIVLKETDETEGYCDSWKFLYYMPKPITIESLQAEVIKADFTGAALIVNKVTGQSFVIIKKACYALDKEGLSMFFSYAPEMKYTTKKYKKVAGVKIEDGSEQTKLGDAMAKNDVSHGVYELEFPKVAKV